MMKVSEFISKLKKAVDSKTLYVTGGWGQPLNAQNKKRFTEGDYKQNKTEPKKTEINSATTDTFAFDCVCLIKGILWGWNADKTKTNGGATYNSNGVPDVTTEAMIQMCDDVSTDFSNIKVGELLWMQGHVGVYIGEGLAIECTPKWDNCVQTSWVNNLRGTSTQHGRTWTKHGKLPWLDYSENVNTNKYTVTVEVNTEKDAKDLKQALKLLGFKVKE